MVAWHQHDSRNAFRNALRDTSQSCHAIRFARGSIQSLSREHFDYWYQPLRFIISTYDEGGGKKRKRKDERPVTISGNFGLRFRAFVDWCTYPNAPSAFSMCSRVSSTRNCAQNLRARHWIYDCREATERYTPHPRKEEKRYTKEHKCIEGERRWNTRKDVEKDVEI